jgi:DNA primase
VSSISVGLLSPRYLLSENWLQMHKIFVPEEPSLLKEAVEKAIYYLKKKKVMKMLEENRKKILEAQTNGDDFTELLTDHMRLEELKIEIAKNNLKIDILK